MRCINCHNLLAETNRDVCIKCLKNALQQDKRAVIGNNAVDTPQNKREAPIKTDY
jgi:hypothetical protein